MQGEDFQSFREFYAVAQEWKFGGGDDGGYDPNIVDCLLPDGYDQEEVLSSYDNGLGTYAIIPAVGLDSEDPQITITNEITTFTLGSGQEAINVTIGWNATDNIGIVSIEIYNGTSLLTQVSGDVTNVTISLGLGIYNISVYAYDSLGNFGIDSILIEIVSPTVGPAVIPGYNVIFIGIFSVFVLVLSIKLTKKKTLRKISI